MSPVAGTNDVETIADEPLTTKEGWRRFVDHQPDPPVLLDAATLAGLSLPDRDCYDEARRVYHGDLPLVNTPIIQKVISTSRLLVQLNRNQVSARRGVIISGASGTGKPRLWFSRSSPRKSTDSPVNSTRPGSSGSPSLPLSSIGYQTAGRRCGESCVLGAKTARSRRASMPRYCSASTTSGPVNGMTRSD
jgi:hypothetical protein